MTAQASAWPEGYKQFIARVMEVLDNPSGPGSTACDVLSHAEEGVW